MSGQRKYIAVENNYQSGKVFGLAYAHKDHPKSPFIKVESFLSKSYALKPGNWI
ncbi:hypothetical protein SAMN04488511_108182 [Pedobacter suwonensis]|uniref:Uncharacterized protein n=1 Tax=Pedobacter suwonensis TaxID=332999 RepID=A0A1I0TD76_9SPHI|nr:hypothetical protein [Pedobacter suwonensis]SFA49689.1 hypothetical protein SAMN04488511_108182 [Pedobacter suwonensis]